MLSRVAAVMAPRTHNRRRVTGSSGRRREGRESERQRPNMSRRVINSAVLLLLVVMICCGSEAAAAVVKQSSETKFQWKGISEGDVTVESLGAPGLLKVGSDVFVVAEAQCKKNGEGADNVFTGVAFRLVTMDKGKEPKEVLKDANEKTQVLEEGASTEGKKRVDVSRPTAVVDESNIYMLVGKYSRTPAAGGADDWGLLLVKGTVSGEESNKQIDWKDTNAVPTKPFGEHDSSMQLIGSGGSGVKMKDGTLVFPLEGTHEKDKTEEDGKTVSLLLYSSDTENWTLSKGMSADGCGYPSVVEWEKDKLMMMTACGDGRRRVYESGDKGTTWTEALGTLSRVWGSKQKGEGKAVGSGFITATFGDGDNEKNVMLVTLPVYSEEKENVEKGELHLWLTDNTHIVDIGPVSGKDDDAAASALLHKSSESGDKKEELIALYERKVGGEKPSHSLWSVRMTEQLQRVKDVLATWKKADKRVSELCSSGNAVQARSTDSACKNTKITAGLVGFLSGNFSDGTWKDEYLGVNATVKKRAEDGAPAGVAETAGSSDGVKFTGRGAWAEWPVGCQGENQLYHFANYNFTLVATVSIDGEPKEGHITLMGAKLNGDDNGKTILLGLSYNKEKKKWILLCGGKQKEMQNRIEEQEKTHQVAIVLQNGNQGSAYVDGQRVGEPCELEIKEDKKISHFYIGGDGSNTEGQGGVSVTVTNVLLYNRPLDDNEITALNAIKPPITPPKETRAQEIVLPSPGRTPQAGQDPLNGDEGVGGDSASPSAASIATTPSSDVAQTVATMGGETVQGGGSPQIREVSMSSGADRETAGGTDGQEEGIHPQDRDVNATALNSSLGNSSQGNNTDASTVSGSGLLPLLLLLLGLWGFAAA
ncbi:putative trans-sialidase, Group V [Trypanosoma cruzi]|nr:putative trans-sialidase, Group V [Trypanosoma cruzi]